MNGKKTFLMTVDVETYVNIVKIVNKKVEAEPLVRHTVTSVVRDIIEEAVDK